MAAPNPGKQRESRAKLDNLFADAPNVWVIHYSCESFYERPNGASPRITSIAARSLETGQTLSFSIHQVAEERGVAFDHIGEQYDVLERQMLDAYYQHVGGHRGMKYLHWNMRDINYGFAALDHRYRVLGGQPVQIDDNRKFDLSRLLIDIYGVDYIGHPRLGKLLAKNDIKPRDFMTGEQEATAFENQNYVGLHQSTLRKVDVIANIAERAYNRQLKTNTTWWEMHGGRVKTFIDWIAENKLISFGIAVVGLILSFWALR
jgi:hypothetical protein